MAGKSVRSNPAIHAAKGDDQIRTGVVGLSTDPVYERRSGSGLGAGFAVAYCLILAAQVSWAFLAVFVIVAGPWAGKAWAGSRASVSPDKEKVASEC